MELLIQTDGVFTLVEVDCFSLCDIIRIEFTEYLNSHNKHFMKDGSGYFYGCICR